jgi:hypothetical protein
VEAESLIIDNGVYRRILSNKVSPDYQTAFSRLIDEVRIGVPVQRIITTPFFFFEAAGLSLQKIGLPTIQLPESLKPHQQVDFIIEQAHQYYATHPELALSSVERELNERLNWLSKAKWAQDLLGDTILRVPLSDVRESMIEHLAFDFAQRRNLYPDFFIVAPVLLRHCHELRADETDIGMYRAIHGYWKEWKDRVDGRDKRGIPLVNEIPPNVERIFRQMRFFGFDDHGELFDSEVVHFGLAGLNEGGVHSVRIITEERPDTIIQRLFLAKSLYKWTVSLPRFHEGREPYPPLKTGYVYVVNQEDLSVREKIDVQLVADVFEEEDAPDEMYPGYPFLT